MAERVLVEFTGEGAGAGELTWGQRGLWQVMEEKHTWLPIGAALRLPAGVTVADAADDLRFVMSRYPSMRTRLRFDPDGPKQVVAGSGQIALEVVDAGDDEDPAAVAEQVRLRYRDTDYDFAAEWPVRMAVVRHRGELTHRVWVMCHLVTDGTGANVILDELAARSTLDELAARSIPDELAARSTLDELAARSIPDELAARSIPDGPSQTPPLEQARWQASPAGQRQCAAALRHWESVLRAVPARRFPPRTDRSGPRYWQARFESPAMHRAVRAVSARAGVEASSVLLAAYAVALVRVTGANPVVAQVVVSNRFRPGLGRTVSPIIQNGLCMVEVPDGTLDDAVAHVRRQALAAYKNAYYDPPRLDALIGRIGRERGERVELDCFFNDRRLRHPVQAGPPPTADQVREALPQTSFVWQYKQDYHPFDSLYVNVDDVPDTMVMIVLSDAHAISPSDVEAFVHGMEEVAVAAALDPATRTVPA